jgi:pimeloyl-ACP methyl ester carboxylesterase
MRGLLTLLWHGPPDAEAVAIMGGGAMGGLLGPADGLYHDLGVALAERGIGTVRVGYRRPNDLEACVLDMGAAAELTSRTGAERFVTVGHSFGGAVAVNAGLAMPPVVKGVVTLSTQSAGCQMAAGLGGRPFLLFHGDRDEILPVAASETVRMMAGYGDLVIMEGTGHLLTEVGAELRARLVEWIPEVLGE